MRSLVPFAVLAALVAAAPVEAAVRPLPRPTRPMPAAGWTSRRVFEAPPTRTPALFAPAPAPVVDPTPTGALAPARKARAAAPLPEGGACEAEIARASRRHGVPEQVLHAVGLTETGRRGLLSPFALNIDGATVFSADANAALARFEQARASGAKFIDLGCMQINHRFHGKAFSSPAAMLEPARNVDYAARFLKQLRAREGSWTVAVARYNAGPNNERAQTRYVCAVIGQLVRSGHGGWTDSARTFCAGQK